MKFSRLIINRIIVRFEKKKRIFLYTDIILERAIHIIYIISISYCIKGEASLKKARGNLLVYERVETHHLSITKKNDPRRVLEDRKTRGILARESLLISKQRIE